MDWIKQRYDQFILLLCALALIGSSAVLIMKSSGFNQVFAGLKDAVKQGNKIPEPAIDELEKASAGVEKPKEWDYASKKDGSLFVSRVYILVDGRLVDPLDENSKPIYDDVPNIWLADNNLDLLDPDVLNKDPDGDKFSNVEEWRGKSNPQSPESHPEHYVKLRFKQWIRPQFRLKYMSRPDSETFLINTVDYKQPSQFLKIGQTIEGSQFKLERFEEKIETDANGIPKDLSELTVKNVETGQEVVLVKEKVVNAPDSFALLSYLWNGADIKAQKDAVFKLPPNNIEYKVIDITEKGAVIQDVKTQEKFEIPPLK